MVTENTTTKITDNIFSGLKVVDLSSFIAGPGAAVILSDFGADVIKVEPPNGDLCREDFGALGKMGGCAYRQYSTPGAQETEVGV